MTRYFIFTGLLLTLILTIPTTSAAGLHSNTAVKTTEETNKATTTSNESAAKMSPFSHTAKPIYPGEKAHTNVPTMDELAHIHHFHKERLKKIKRHHKKCWTLSQLLLLFCHAAVLIISYLHVTH